MNSIKIYVKIIRTLSKIFDLRSVKYFQNLHTSIQFETVRNSGIHKCPIKNNLKIRTRSEIFKLVRKYSNSLGNIRTRLEIFELVWKYSNSFGNIWTRSEIFELVRKYSNSFGNIWTRWLQLSISKCWILFTYVNIWTRWL